MGQYTEAGGTVLGFAIAFFAGVISKDGLAGEIRQQFKRGDYVNAAAQLLLAEGILLLSLLLFTIGYTIGWFLVGIMLAIALLPLAAIGLSNVVAGILAVIYVLGLVVTAAFVHLKLFAEVTDTEYKDDLRLSVEEG